MRSLTLFLLFMSLVFTGCSDLTKDKASSISSSKIVFLYDEIAYERVNFPIEKEYVHYKFMVKYFDASKEIISSGVTWTSSQPDIATVDVNGTAHLLNIGETMITATAKIDDVDFTAQTLLNVRENAVQSITIIPKEMQEVPKGSSIAYRALATLNGFDFPVPVTKWTEWSSDSSTVTLTIEESKAIAQVDPLAVEENVGIVAVYKAVSDSAVLKIVAPKLISISVTPDTNVTVDVNSTIEFTAEGNYTDGSTKDVTADMKWESSDETVLQFQTLNKNRAKGIAPGDVNITVKDRALLPTVKKTIEVKVNP